MKPPPCPPLQCPGPGRCRRLALQRREGIVASALFMAVLGTLMFAPAYAGALVGALAGVALGCWATSSSPEWRRCK